MNFVLLFLFCLASYVYSTPTQRCSDLAINPARFLQGHNVISINATEVAAGALNIFGVVNKASFCQVISSVAYGCNSTLNFELWLPDQNAYSERFMAIGKEHPDLHFITSFYVKTDCFQVTPAWLGLFIRSKC